MKKIQLGILLSVFLIFPLVLSLFVNRVDAFRSENAMDRPSPPRLRYPITASIDLKGKDYLEFQWWDSFGWVAGYEFRLFRGYNMYAQDQIMKEKLPARTTSLKVKADVFEEGQVYTWALTKVALGGWKSDKSYESFQVIKK
jgi:hypothetical protein